MTQHPKQIKKTKPNQTKMKKKKKKDKKQVANGSESFQPSPTRLGLLWLDLQHVFLEKTWARALPQELLAKPSSMEHHRARRSLAGYCLILPSHTGL